MFEENSYSMNNSGRLTDELFIGLFPTISVPCHPSACFVFLRGRVAPSVSDTATWRTTADQCASCARHHTFPPSLPPSILPRWAGHGPQSAASIGSIAPSLCPLSLLLACPKHVTLRISPDALQVTDLQQLLVGVAVAVVVVVMEAAWQVRHDGGGGGGDGVVTRVMMPLRPNHRNTRYHSIGFGGGN